MAYKLDIPGDVLPAWHALPDAVRIDFSVRLLRVGLHLKREGDRPFEGTQVEDVMPLMYLLESGDYWLLFEVRHVAGTLVVRRVTRALR